MHAGGVKEQHGEMDKEEKEVGSLIRHPGCLDWNHRSFTNTFRGGEGDKVDKRIIRIKRQGWRKLSMRG